MKEPVSSDRGQVAQSHKELCLKDGKLILAIWRQHLGSVVEARETDCGEDEGSFAGGEENCEQRMDHSSLHLSDQAESAQ